MGNKIKIKHYIGFIFLTIYLSNLVFAEEVMPTKQGITFPEVFISSDSENLNVRKYSTAYMPVYQHGDLNSGIRLQHLDFEQQSWGASGKQLSLFAKNIDPKTALGYSINFGVNDIHGKSVITTDSQYSFELESKTRVELILNRDRVETQKSIENNISYTMLALNVDQEIFKNLTAIAMVGNMNFSDSNSRPFVRLRLVADVIPEYGINLQLRYRRFHSTDINVERNYFNPEDYQETMVLLGFRKRIQGWMLAGTAGYGQQQIDYQQNTNTKLLDLSVTSPIQEGIFFRAKAGFNQSAGFQGPDYYYRYFMQELIFSF